MTPRSLRAHIPWILGALCLGGCQELGNALVLVMLSGVLVGALLMQAACLGVALLPLVRRPVPQDEPEIRAPRGPSALGVAALVGSGFVEWFGFVALMHRPERALLGELGLAAFLASAVLHGLTLAVVLRSHTSVSSSHEEAHHTRRMQVLRAGLAGVYWLASIAAGLWPWLASL